MIIALGVMLVTALLLVAAFTAANGNIHVSHHSLTEKQAYYAALAGVQEYEYLLQANPDSWETCAEPSGALPGTPEGHESYEITLLPASTAPKETKKCNAGNPFATMIESKAPLANTFRIKSTGKAGSVTRAVIATFQVTGFLDYIYFTQYEVEDPEAYKGGNPECANYRKRREELHISCQNIVFGPEDTVNGPMHTDDSALVCGGAEFGRPAHEPPDIIEMNGGAIEAGCGSGSAIYNTPTGGPITGPELEAPESDTSLRDYVERKPEHPQENEFTGLTHLVLEGSFNRIKVTTFVSKKAVTETIEWPKNGLIYIQSNSSGCSYKYEQTNSDNSTTLPQEENCGSVYVSGNYSKPLTIGAEVDLIIDGSLTPTGVTPPAAPSGSSTVTLGLIASRFVRVYHPCEGGKNGGESLTNPWIYAAILSTRDSFVVDNYNCGATLGNLNIDGAIAQKFRGIVGEVGTHGYVKEYTYDERLATDEPPYFLAPLKAGWRIARETDANAG